MLPDGAGLAEVVGDTGYHSNATLVALADVDIRSYVSEPARGRRHWHGKREARDAVYGNRRRIQGTRGQRSLIHIHLKAFLGSCSPRSIPRSASDSSGPSAPSSNELGS